MYEKLDVWQMCVCVCANQNANDCVFVCLRGDGEFWTSWDNESDR